MSLPYGAVVLDHFRRPRNQRQLNGPSGAHEAYNPMCGDRVRMEVAVVDGALRDAAFTANACAICTASASLLTERVRGAAVAAATTITDDDVVGWLESDVPPARRACAVLPLSALREALKASRA